MVVESAKNEDLELGELRTFRLEGGMSAKDRRNTLTEIALAREEGCRLPFLQRRR